MLSGEGREPRGKLASTWVVRLRTATGAASAGLRGSWVGRLRTHAEMGRRFGRGGVLIGGVRMGGLKPSSGWRGRYTRRRGAADAIDAVTLADEQVRGIVAQRPLEPVR